MLRLIAYGSGSVDCVYHLALPELRAAARRWRQDGARAIMAPRQELERMVGQGRVRDYDDSCAKSIPPGPPETKPLTGRQFYARRNGHPG